MRRQRIIYHTSDLNVDDYQGANMSCQPINKESNQVDDFLQMEHLTRGGKAGTGRQHRFENTIEAKVSVGDTLQALALRFHCTVAEIKRLNKIGRENEIYARKVIKIPVTAHSVLLETLPAIHKSGSNSPSQGDREDAESSIMRNPLEDAKIALGEKLIVASVNAANISQQCDGDIKNATLNSKIAGRGNGYKHEDIQRSNATINANDATSLLDDIMDDEFLDTHVRPIPGPSLSALQWSGSDCDMTWVCLFVVILALCFIIPLLVVIIGTHPHSSNSATVH